MMFVMQTPAVSAGVRQLQRKICPGRAIKHYGLSQVYNG